MRQLEVVMGRFSTLRKFVHPRAGRIAIVVEHGENNSADVIRIFRTPYRRIAKASKVHAAR